MWPVLGGLISGASSLLGGIFSSNTSAQNTQAQIAAQQASQRESETFNAGEAQKGRDFSEQMSNTAFQRASADMKAAGLNPMIMASGGGSASTPGASTASVGTPSVPMPQNTHPLAGLGTAVSKAVDTAVTAKTYDKMTDEIANLRAENAKIIADVDLSRAHGTESTQRSRVLDVERQLKNLGLPGAELTARSARDVATMPDEILKGINRGKYQDHHVGGLVGGVVGSAEAAARAIRDKFGGASFSDRFNSIYGNSN